MDGRWIRRREHLRRNSSGSYSTVRATWVLATPVGRKNNSYRSPCPSCGEAIISVHMPNGGWSHYNGSKGLETTKQRCFTIGNGLSGGDEATPDLFDSDPKS